MMNGCLNLQVEQRILKILKSEFKKSFKSDKWLAQRTKNTHDMQICEETWVGGVKRIVYPLVRGGLSPQPAVQTLSLAARFCGNNQQFLWKKKQEDWTWHYPCPWKRNVKKMPYFR